MGMKDYVSIPLNFERRPEVRMLARRLGPLTIPRVVAEEHPWEREALIEAALDAGVLAVEYHGDVAGLAICGVFGFADLNAHLLPGYESMQQKGAKASQESRRRKVDDVAGAKQQRRILEAREERLPIFESQAATTAEVNAALALISGVDRACGHTARLAGEFTQPLVEAAVEVARGFQASEIEEAMNCLIKGRDNPAIVKRTDFVLTHFAEYVTRRAPSCDKRAT